MGKWKEGDLMQNTYQEADAWFQRNEEALKTQKEITKTARFVLQFLKENKILSGGESILEIGSSYGYNLKYLSEQLEGGMYYGIDPSADAIEYGKVKYKQEIELHHGRSDNLPWEDEKMDVVILGFCMYQVDRKYLMRTISEVDRVLKENGFLMLIDFDTDIPYKRENKHTSGIYTFKMKYENLFLANPQYYLVEKKSFSHTSHCFTEDIQERLAFTVLYKNNIDNSYVIG